MPRPGRAKATRDEDDADFDDEPADDQSLCRKIERYARTLTAQELSGAENCAAAGEDAAMARARRLEVYRRAAFGLASAAERASLIAVNAFPAD